MKVPCYICDAPTEIDDILSHLRRHSDSDTSDAMRRVARERSGKPAKKAKKPLDLSGLGGSYVKLDKNKGKVVE